MGLTYFEAKTLADSRNEKWRKYWESQGSPTGSDFETCVLDAPDDVYSYNAVSRTGGVTLAAESSDHRVYEYPAGLMAWSGEIPKEAFVGHNEIYLKNWEVVSRRETYDW